MRRAVPLCFVIGLIATACGSGDSSGCAELREAEDQQSGRHVLSDAGLVYLSDPPTSGPHASGASPTGALDSPLLAPVQVRILEGGGVVLQYEDGVGADTVTLLESIASDTIVVAPAHGDLPSPIVATAWTWKLTCGEPDLERIREFADARRVDAPGYD